MAAHTKGAAVRGYPTKRKDANWADGTFLSVADSILPL
jgi:hypothetical protein